ncbi:MAG TPA: protoporphyrinogen oxidase [Pyrinomonadaceae bacterium]|nr:protoporphyrinogen oxidase [Pyrinomonadaceae bacterium]
MIGTLDTARREVTIIGAGVSGMLAAYALDKKGYRVTLVEEKAKAGGLIQTRRTAYGMAETAAHSLLATPEVFALCEELGVELAEVRRDSRARFIVRGGRLRKFPLSAGEAVRTFARAAFARGENHPDEQDLETWGRRHLGEAAVDNLLAPFVCGIYGVRPSELGVAAAFPELAVEPGRTLLGTLLGKALGRDKKSRGKKNGGEENGGGEGNDKGRAGGRGAAAVTPEKKQRKRMVAPLRGMGDLTSRLEAELERRLGERFRRGVPADQIPDAPNVIVTVPAYAAARLFADAEPELARSLEAVRYTPVVSATAFVEQGALRRPVKGVGALAAAREGRQSLGVLFTSSAFEGRVADEGRLASFAVLLGGTSRPGWAAASDAEIRLAVASELRDLAGLKDAPLEVVISRWPRAIPQYSTGLPAVWQKARETWCSRPGRVLFGNYTGQVSLRGMIEEAARLG